MSNFDSLPNEIVRQVFRNLEHDDKVEARLVCHRWRCLLDVNLIFRAEVTDESLQHFLASYRIMKSATVSGLTSRLPRLSCPKNNLPMIHEIILGPKNSQAAIRNFLKYGCETAQSLQIPLKTLAPIRRYVISKMLLDIQWNTLKKLELNAQIYRRSPNDIKHLKSSSTFLKFAKIPNLQDFSIQITIKSMPQRGTDHEGPILENLYKFIANNSENLKNYNFKFRCEATRTRFLRIQRLQENRIILVGIRRNEKFVNRMEEIGKTLNLETCRVELFRYCDPGKTTVVPQLYGSRLKTMQIIMPRDPRSEGINLPMFLNNDNMKQIFNANATTLEKVILRVRNFDVSWLRNCSNLKTLEISLRYGTLEWTDRSILKISQLKSLRLGEFREHYLPPSLQQLVTSNKATLEELHLDLRPAEDQDLNNYDWEWLNGLTRVWYLEFQCPLYESILAKLGQCSFMKNLKEFNLEKLVYPGGTPETHLTRFANWIRNTMPKLVKLHINLLWVQTLDIYLEMKNLKELTFLTDEDEPEIRVTNFCMEEPGLHLNNTEPHTSYHLPNKFITSLLIDRPRPFGPRNKITN